MPWRRAIQHRDPVKCLSHQDGASDADDRGWFKARSRDIGRDCAERGFQNPLFRFRRVGDDRDRLAGRPAGGDQLRRNPLDVLHAHVDDDDLAAACDGGPVERLRGVAALVMAGHEGHGLIDVAVRYRNTGIGQTADARRDARNYADRDAMLNQCLGFFAAAPEHERIATFQAQDAFALSRQINQPQRDIALLGRWLAAAFAGIDQLRFGLCPVQNPLIDQRVINNHVRLPQRVQRMQCQKTRVAGACTAQPDPAGFQRRPVIRGKGILFVHRYLMSKCRTVSKRNRDAKRAIGVKWLRAYGRGMTRKPTGDLRRGWTTGACATAATKAALFALWGDGFPREVGITLPKGETPRFPLAHQAQGDGWAEAGITKDAGDDPDVTHGALIIARVEASGGGVEFVAGDGVGTVSKPGLPIGVGEAAINPVPRQMMQEVVAEMAALFRRKPDVRITVSVPGGQELAKKTWNPRLGIVGGISILGTTGIVRPFSCSAWIASIHRGIDVARADHLEHVAGCTGSTSEAVVQKLYELPDHAMLDMGDFSGGLLKYLAKHPVPRLTIGGGIGKITKLAQGARDLHSSRTQVDFGVLNAWAQERGLPDISEVNTALEAIEIAGEELAKIVAERARDQVETQLTGTDIRVDVVVIDRAGRILGRAE